MIEPDNASQVVEMERLGSGHISGGVAWSPDGKIIAVGTTIGVWLYNAADLSQPGRLLAGHDNYVRSVAFSPERIVSTLARLFPKDRALVKNRGRQETLIPRNF